MVALAFIVLMGAFGLNLSAGQFFAPLRAEYGWPLSTLSLAVAVNMLVWGILQPFMGRLVDRIGARPVITASTALMGVAFLLSTTIDQKWEFFLYYGVLTAVGFAGCGSMANSVLIARWYRQQRATMLARSSMGLNVGQLLFLPLAGWLIYAGGADLAFATLGALMLLVITPLVAFGMRNDPADLGQQPDGEAGSATAPPPSASLSDALRSGDFWAATLGFVTCGYSLYMVTMHLPAFAVDLGGSQALGGQLLGIAAGMSAVTMLYVGQLVGWLGKKPLLIGLYLLRAAALAWLALAAAPWQLYVFAVIYGVSSMPIIPLKTGLIGDRFGAAGLGAIMGSAWFAHQIMAALGVYFGGVIREATASYAPAFASAAILLVLGGLATSFVRLRAPEPAPA
jgi:MFS family permease